jgi:hypothetical protein
VLGDVQLVLDGEVQPLLLRTVAHRGVEDVNRFHVSSSFC